MKSLAAEARIINRERQRVSADIARHLHLHRINCVRPEARMAQLLYAFVRGAPKEKLERTSREMGRFERKLFWDRAHGKCKRFGIDFHDFKRWFNGRVV